MRKFHPLLVVVLGLSLSGCFGDSSESVPPPETITGSTTIDDIILGDDFDINTAFRASFDPLKGIAPYPNDILGFLADPDTDGTINLPADQLTFQILASEVNKLDGFSTFGRVTANFSGAVSETSLAAPGAVTFVEVVLDPATKATVGVVGPLIPGVDYNVGLAPDVDAGGQTVEISMIRPLNPKSGYLLILTDAVTDTGGTPAVPDTTYQGIKDALAAGITLPDPTEDLLKQFIGAHLAIAGALGIPSESVIVTASYSTLSTSDALESVNASAAAQFVSVEQAFTPIDLPNPDGGIIPAGTPVTTGLVLGLLEADSQCDPTAGFPLPGCGIVYSGAISLPYYLEPPADQNDPIAVSSIWEGTPGLNPLDPDSITLSRFNPVPNKKFDQLAPVIMAVPGPNSDYVQAGFSRPPEGWPTLIFLHGVTRNRLDMFALAEGWNNAGFAVIAIDQVLHGITATDPAEDTTALFRVPGVDERTFDLDLVQNDNPGDATPDGLIDGSGIHFLNPGPDRLLPTGDHFRQSAADIIHLIRSIPGIDLDGDAAGDLDGSRVHYAGHSLGALVGNLVIAVNGDLASATLANTGGCLSCGLFESPTFEATLGAGLVAALGENGILPDTTTFNNYLRDGQNLADAGDALSYGLAWGNSQVVPAHLFVVQGDAVVPESMFNRVALAMGLPQVPQSTPPVFPFPVFVGPDTDGVNGGYTFFTAGDHGSILDPTASAAATVEMQTQAVVFGAGNPPAMIPGNGQVILISDPTVLDTDGP
jgi:pimeloyl-ACP methyl ester carboxylesterase